MVRQRKIAAINAIAFSIFWLLILLAGADKPPPLGFIWLIIVVALCALVVFRRILPISIGIRPGAVVVCGGYCSTALAPVL